MIRLLREQRDELEAVAYHLDREVRHLKGLVKSLREVAGIGKLPSEET